MGRVRTVTDAGGKHGGSGWITASCPSQSTLGHPIIGAAETDD